MGSEGLTADAKAFWDTHCVDCGHDMHPMNVCSTITGGDHNGPDYCPCALDYPALAAEYQRRLAAQPAAGEGLRYDVTESGEMVEAATGRWADALGRAPVVADSRHGTLVCIPRQLLDDLLASVEGSAHKGSPMRNKASRVKAAALQPASEGEGDDKPGDPYLWESGT